jgi:hypothetical protein
MQPISTNATRVSEHEGSNESLLGRSSLDLGTGRTTGTDAVAVASRADGSCGEGRRHASDGLE